MAKNTETVLLDIEGTILESNRKTLIEHSPYFQAMLEGNFLESSLKAVKLQGVDLEAMKIILSITHNQPPVMSYEHMLMILQTARMLQFDKIVQDYVEEITVRLNHKNCLEVWLIAEQLSLNTLYLKAKSIAMIEFDKIRHCDCIMELNLNQLYKYLGNVALRAANEIDVFETLMKWWYHNQNNPSKILLSSETDHNLTRTLLFLFSCLDFKSLSHNNLSEIITYPDIHDNTFMKQIVNCLVDIKTNSERKGDDRVAECAALLLQSKSRFHPTLPCISAKIETISEEIPVKKARLQEKPTNILYFDALSGEMQLLLEISTKTTHICERLEGYRVHGYKNEILILGGEHTLGTGDWNKNIWSYNFVVEKWEIIQQLPKERRHFKTYCVNGELFIIGGTTKYRVVLDTMIIFSLENHTWSSSINLPYRFMDIVCCEHNGCLLIMPKDVKNNKTAYLYKNQQWIPLKICDSSVVVKYPEKYVLYSYNNYIFMKGEYIIQLLADNSNLQIVSCTKSEPILSDVEDCVLCDKFLYTFSHNSCITHDDESFSVERFNVDTLEAQLCVYKIPNNGNFSGWRIASGCFAFQLYKMLEDDVYVSSMTVDFFNRLEINQENGELFTH